MRRLTGAGRRKLVLFGFGLALAGCVPTPPPGAETEPQTVAEARAAPEAATSSQVPAPEAAAPSPAPVPEAATPSPALAPKAAAPSPVPAPEAAAPSLTPAPKAATPSPVPAAVVAAEPAPPPAPEAAAPSPVPAAVVAAEPAPPPAARAAKHMVVAANPLAAQAGLEILRAGGSAIDAAIAVQMVLNVVEPQSSGIGGGGFLVHYSAKSESIETYDGRETAPASATPDMFLNSDGSRRKFHDAVSGGLSVGVPGLLRMLEAAHKDHGRLPWRQLFDSAIELADDGFEISPRLHGLVSRDRHLKKFDTTRSYFFDAAGEAKSAGTRLINRPLASTFKVIADFGPDAFYIGPIAEDIVAAARGASPNPGRITANDLQTYRAKKRGPVCSFYRQWVICGAPPPTSGGVSTLQILGTLQEFDLAAMQPGSAEAVHLIAEASRLAFADRGQYLADPDAVRVPVARMIDPGYLAMRAKLISRATAMEKAEPGGFTGQAELRYAPSPDEHGQSTTHFSIVDGDGNVVSLTSSIKNAFGSRLMVRGFLLNNQLTDFSFSPIRNGRPIANAAAANKRPRSSMSPTLVLNAGGKPVLAVGTPGGSSIIGYVAKTIIGVLDWKLDPQAAIDAPHYVNRNGPTDLEADTPVAALQPVLEGLGHKVRVRDMVSGLHAIQITENGLLGGADPRGDGVAIGD